MMSLLDPTKSPGCGDIIPLLLKCCAIICACSYNYISLTLVFKRNQSISMEDP